VAIPAVTQVISRRVVDREATVREEVIPAVYRTATRQVVDVAPSLREIKIPAQYENLEYQVKVTDARLERRALDRDADEAGHVLRLFVAPVADVLDVRAEPEL
jgi:hypothetical protein